MSGYIASAAVFALIFPLYGLPVEPLLYGLLLLLAAGGATACVRAARAQRFMRTKEPPTPRSGVERVYAGLLAEERKMRAGENEAQSRARRELIDYLTLWAHQIKTPLAALRLMSEPDDVAIMAELLKTEQYVDIVLQYMRLEDASTDYLFASCAVDDLVRAALRKYSRLFILKKLAVSFEPTGLVVVTDEKWLSFAIEQTLTNALKYTRRGGISIYAADGALCIADTGIGILPADLPRICEKGFTGRNGRLDKQATGIGLYLTKRVLNRLSHDIAVESTPGVGTTVSIILTKM